MPAEGDTMAQNSGQGITIYDVAKKANVSISTVSRVFNNSPLVSSKTRKKVQKVIDEMGFVPSSIARSLVSASSKTIGLIVSDITNPFFADTIDGIESVLHSEGFSVFLCDTRYNREREANYINQMLEKRVDGIIIFSADISGIELLTGIKNELPIVSIQSAFKEVDCVNTTDEEGAYEAVDFLIKSGHRKIAFLVYDYDNSTITNTMKGYLRAHDDEGIPVNDDYIIKMKFNPNAGYYMAKELLESHPEVTAIFAYNDMIAIGAYMAIYQKGLKIPDDISVVGYDDIEMASIISPGITTVSQPFYEMGRTAAELLLKRIKEEDRSIPQTILLPTRLTVRGSTRTLTP
jgi:LacI family transcriptional regulator